MPLCHQRSVHVARGGAEALMYVCCDAAFRSVILAVAPVQSRLSISLQMGHVRKAQRVCEEHASHSLGSSSAPPTVNHIHERLFCYLWHVFFNPLDLICIIKEPHAHISDLVKQQRNYSNELMCNAALSLIPGLGGPANCSSIKCPMLLKDLRSLLLTTKWISV